TVNAQTFIEHLIKMRLPAVHQWPELADEGGLVAYGPRFTEVFRQRARMVVGRRPSVRVAMPVMGRHPKTFTGSVNTAWTYGTGNSSASRSASHCFAEAPWHFGQCRLRQEL